MVRPELLRAIAAAMDRFAPDAALVRLLIDEAAREVTLYLDVSAAPWGPLGIPNLEEWLARHAPGLRVRVAWGPVEKFYPGP